ncbi:cinnamoyl-CoA reductase 1-like protein isoform X2 [Tanacetum coccineum]
MYIMTSRPRTRVSVQALFEGVTDWYLEPSGSGSQWFEYNEEKINPLVASEEDIYKIAERVKSHVVDKAVEPGILEETLNSVTTSEFSDAAKEVVGTCRVTGFVVMTWVMVVWVGCDGGMDVEVVWCMIRELRENNESVYRSSRLEELKIKQKKLQQIREEVTTLVKELDIYDADPKKTEHLLALDGAKERLSLYEATLTEDGSFDSAVNGCVCIFHTASPVQFTVDDPQAQLIDPAVKGTLNVLKSASKVPSLKRVVFTSSIAAVVWGEKVPVFGDMVDETWFSDPLLWYNASKTMAENAAVKFSQENGLDLVSINPGFVIGPILQPTLNTTSEGFMNLIECGKEVFLDGVYRLVDVRDVAIAHILAFENPKANGRYCVVGNVIQSSEIMKIVDKFYPSLDNSKRCKDGKSLEPLIYNVSRVKMESLGVEFTPVEVSIKDTIESLKDKKLTVKQKVDHPLNKSSHHSLLLPKCPTPTLTGFGAMNGEGKVVSVTGASGFIASWLVKLLLARGYTVHATVRSLDDPTKTEHLLALDGAKERLSLFEANLMDEGSFDSAVNGCVCIFHTASPVIFSVSDPKVGFRSDVIPRVIVYVELLDPAVKGTLNVLKSAAKVPSLKRVILTSSTAAVACGAKIPVFGDVVDETWFSDLVICEQKKMWYPLSKTLAEDAAVKFAKENGLDLVSIHPGYVIGPMLQPTLNFTSEGIINLIKFGTKLYSDGIYRLADVRDVSNAHILAFENPKAKGRYLMVESTSVESLTYNVSRARAEDHGVEFTPAEITIKDTVESIKLNNLLIF